MFMSVLLLIVIQAIIMIGFYLFAGIVAGIFGYSIQFLCSLCDQGNYYLAILFTVLFPVTICIGLYKGITELFY